MVGGHELGAFVIVETPSEGGDPLFGFQEGLGGKGSEGADDSWFDGLQLFDEKGETGLDLIGSGITVIGGTAFYDVGDVYLISGQFYGLNDTSEKFPCPADKGLALEVLFSARTLSYKDEGGMGVAFAEDHVVSPLMESAPSALPQLLSDAIEVQVFSSFALREEGLNTQLILIAQMPLDLGD